MKNILRIIIFAAFCLFQCLFLIGPEGQIVFMIQMLLSNYLQLIESSIRMEFFGVSISLTFAIAIGSGIVSIIWIEKKAFRVVGLVAMIMLETTGLLILCQYMWNPILAAEIAFFGGTIVVYFMAWIALEKTKTANSQPQR